MLSIEALVAIVRSEAVESDRACLDCGTLPSNARDSDRCPHRFGLPLSRHEREGIARVLECDPDDVVAW